MNIGKKHSVLIVEDDAVLGENLREGLSQLGYIVFDVCSTGEFAIQQAKEKNPDILIMDINLKGEMSGIDAYKEINRFRDIPVIYLTAYNDTRLQQEANKTLPEGFLNKPVSVEDVHEAIKKGLFSCEISKDEDSNKNLTSNIELELPGNTKMVLIVDDSTFLSDELGAAVKAVGLDVCKARTYDEAIDHFSTKNIDAVILDIEFELGSQSKKDDEILRRSWAGKRSGLILAEWVKKTRPKTFLIAYSNTDSEEIIDWFRGYGGGFVNKFVSHRDLVTSHILPRLNTVPLKNKDYPRCFIVHGHDKTSKGQLRKFLVEKLDFPEPIILQKQASPGYTIIEKLEKAVKEAHLVFILLTPDDFAFSKNSSVRKNLRARQNVIYEMGFFIGKWGRKSGRVILLYKDKVELPSDIFGVTYIDITNGIYAVKEEIENTISLILPKL